MNSLNAWYEKLGRTKFLNLAAALMFASDALNFSYIQYHMLPNLITPNYLASVHALGGIQSAGLNPLYLEELGQVIGNSLFYVFAGFLIYHGFIYFRLSKNSRWAKRYVSFYTLTGAVLTLMELPSLVARSLPWSAAMLVTTGVYVFAFWGLRLLKKKEAPQT